MAPRGPGLWSSLPNVTAGARVPFFLNAGPSHRLLPLPMHSSPLKCCIFRVASSAAGLGQGSPQLPSSPLLSLGGTGDLPSYLCAMLTLTRQPVLVCPGPSLWPGRTPCGGLHTMGEWAHSCVWPRSDRWGLPLRARPSVRVTPDFRISFALGTVLL